MNCNLKKKLILGTANFGMPYGTRSKTGAIHINAIEKILNLMAENNLLRIDTAQAYGNAESVLGDIGMKDFKVFTKITIKKGENISDKVEASLRNLKLSALEGVLIHNAEFINEDDLQEAIEKLEALKKEGTINKIGISIYNPTILTKLPPGLTIDICQAPVNIINRKFLENSCIQSLKSISAELHARSVFLQGALLMEKKEFLDYFSGKFLMIFEEYDYFIKNLNLTRLDYCLGWALEQSSVAKIPIGVDSVEQLSTILKITEYPLSQGNFLYSGKDNIQSFADPRSW